MSDINPMSEEENERTKKAHVERMRAEMDTKAIRRILLRNRLICSKCDAIFKPVEYKYGSSKGGVLEFLIPTTYRETEILCHTCADNTRLRKKGLVLSGLLIAPKYVLLNPPEPEVLRPDQTRITIQELIDLDKKSLSGPPTNIG